MAHALTDDSVRLYYEEAGSGSPIVFVHEFAGDHRSWEAQIRFFSRRHRCVVFAARGYPPSDVPERPEQYSQARAVQDILAVMDHLQIGRAHLIGLSMGGYATLHFGLDHPERVLSLVVAGAGYGSEKHLQREFRDNAAEVARNFLDLGSGAFASVYGSGASRIQLQNKDPRGWQEFIRMLGEHSALGSANTMLGVQAQRPSIYDLAWISRRTRDAKPRARGACKPSLPASIRSFEPKPKGGPYACQQGLASHPLPGRHHPGIMGED